MLSYASRFAVGLALCATIACGSSSNESPVVDAAVDDLTPGTDTTVTAFAGTHVYFGQGGSREVDAEVTFPAPELRYRKVTLRLGLRCPTGGCDWWDRLARLSLLTPDPAGGDAPVEIELARFITPYRVGGELTVDVTDLQRLLEGKRTVRVFIDTWVGPGHANGAGWLVDAAFEFEAGIPSPDPFAVVPLWRPSRVVYGDPARPIDVSATVDIPAETSGVRLRALVTGHGQGNAGNCAEFCRRDHTFTVGNTPVTRSLWRDDCPTTAVPGQQGTWMYARAGWCPGAMVTPWIADVPTPAAGPLTVTYDVAAYENSCRPDAPTCVGCTLGTGCAYDGGAHTEPGWEHSGLLILMR